MQSRNAVAGAQEAHRSHPLAAIKRAASARGNLTGAQFGGCLKKSSACLQMGARLLKSIREIEDFVVPLHR